MPQRFVGSVVVLALICAATAVGDEVRVVKLEVTPAARPVPMLQYRFWPADRELVDGNGAALYYRAILMLKERTDDQLHKAADWLELPPEEVPREEARKLLNRYDSFLREARLGARRRDAKWDLPLADQGIWTLLPEIQESRALARLMALEARLDILDDDYKAASNTIETMLTMGRHVGESGTLVSLLVGLAIQGITAEEIQHWIAQPDSPNAYWALTTVPQRLGDAAAALETEHLWITGSLPCADLLDKSILTPQQTDRLAVALGEILESEMIGETKVQLQSGETVPLSEQSAILPIILRAYPVAKRQLIEACRDEAEVEAMPPIQVVMLRTVQIYREFLDEMVMWANHTPAEMRAAADEITQRLNSLDNNPEAFLAAYMLPAVRAVGSAVARLQRTYAMLRVIEALRLYAALHDGELPASLDDITEVPIPLDPVVNRPFNYRLDGKTGILTPAEKGLVGLDWQYEITVRR